MTSKRDMMVLRNRALASIRAFFDARGFLEVQTPTVVPSPGMEPNLAPFVTELRRNDGAAFRAGLITSPEYAMKRLLADGYERIYEIARCYRNEEPWDGGHNPEFTMLEWYRADADYEDIMRDTEELVAHVAGAVGSGEQGAVIRYGGTDIDLAAPWERLSVTEAFRRYADMNLLAGIDDPASFVAEAARRGDALATDSFEDAFHKVFLTRIERKLGQGKPTILYDYPASMAALSKRKASDSRLAERFEAYVSGVELCNAFSELTDAAEQRRRLTEEQEERRREGKDVFPVDEAFLEAVGRMPRSGGIALGVDRLLLLLADARDISDVLFFPAKDLFLN